MWIAMEVTENTGKSRRLTDAWEKQIKDNGRDISSSHTTIPNISLVSVLVDYYIL